MEQVLQHYGILENFKKSGDSLNGPCPVHKGSNPTQFRVSVSKNIWNCFSECKHGGNVLDFIAKMENASIHAAALKAIEWFGLDPEAMSAATPQEDDHPDLPRKGGDAAPPKPAAIKPAPVQEKNTPNYFGHLTGTDPNADPDHDGASNLAEWLAGTNPTNATSCLRLAIPKKPATNGFVVHWPSVAGKFYRLQRATNLLTGFNTLQTNIAATPPTNTVVDTINLPGEAQFYRLELEQ